MGIPAEMPPLREGDTILIEATVTARVHPGSKMERIAIKVGDPMYGTPAAVHPDQFHALRRRFFRPGEMAELIGPEEEAVEVLAIDGDFAWVKRDNGSRETFPTTKLMPIFGSPIDEERGE